MTYYIGGWNVYAQTGGGGTINMQAVPLSTAGSSATLTWQPPAWNTDGTPLTDLSAFKVYLLGAYAVNVSLLDSHCELRRALAHRDRARHRTWYLVVTALNASGVESPRSNVWRKTVR